MSAAVAGAVAATLNLLRRSADNEKPFSFPSKKKPQPKPLIEIRAQITQGLNERALIKQRISEWRKTNGEEKRREASNSKSAETDSSDRL